MKKITIMIPYSWGDDRVAAVIENYRKAGYDVVVMSVPG